MILHCFFVAPVRHTTKAEERDDSELGSLPSSVNSYGVLAYSNPSSDVAMLEDLSILQSGDSVRPPIMAARSDHPSASQQWIHEQGPNVTDQRMMELKEYCDICSDTHLDPNCCQCPRSQPHALGFVPNNLPNNDTFDQSGNANNQSVSFNNRPTEAVNRMYNTLSGQSMCSQGESSRRVCDNIQRDQQCNTNNSVVDPGLRSDRDLGQLGERGEPEGMSLNDQRSERSVGIAPRQAVNPFTHTDPSNTDSDTTFVKSVLASDETFVKQVVTEDVESDVESEQASRDSNKGKDKGDKCKDPDRF